MCRSAARSTYRSSFSDVQPQPSHTPSSVATCYILHHYLEDLAISVNAFKAFLHKWKSPVPLTSHRMGIPAPAHCSSPPLTPFQFPNILTTPKSYVQPHRVT